MRNIRRFILELGDSLFSIDLISFGHGNFDVIVGMDWLSKHKAKIVCYEKVQICCIFLDGYGVLVVRTLALEEMMLQRKNTKGTLLKQQYENFNATSSESLDSIFNRLQMLMRARKFYQRTGRKIIIDGSSTAGYDKSKVECFNCHKMGHFARECRAPRSKDNRNWNQGSSSKAVRIEDASEKAMCAIDGGGFDWSDMAEDEIQANMALMAFTDLEIALLKRSVGHKDYLIGLVKTELEKVKEEKEGFEFKLAKFEKSSKDLDDLLASQVTERSKRVLVTVEKKVAFPDG
ncbi:ribonuclease H-like domain-containing protein [Tanacetum coccineum]